jgi:hypothetical protein
MLKEMEMEYDMQSRYVKAFMDSEMSYDYNFKILPINLETDIYALRDPILMYFLEEDMSAVRMEVGTLPLLFELTFCSIL